MATENKVTLHGFWPSPFAKRVELALKAKGIAYDYIEEDLMNKSPELLTYNPALKKVPVLVHNGKPICESVVIVEYIDETWKDGPKLLPEDPYMRSQVRFWASFIDNNVLDEHLTNYDPSFTCIDSKNVGLLDFVFGSAFGGENILEEVLGRNVIDVEKVPAVCLWIQSLNDNPLMKEASIPKEKIVGFLKCIRDNALKSSTN